MNEMNENSIGRPLQIITDTGLNLPGDCTEEQFFSVGHILSNIEHGLQWAIGDWYNAIPWGDKKKACDKAGLNYQSAKQCGRVAAIFQMGARAPILTYSHHRVLSAEDLDDEDREDLIHHAESERWSVAKLAKARDKVLGKPEPVPLAGFDTKVDKALNGLPKTASKKIKRDILAVFNELKHQFQTEVEKAVRVEMLKHRKRMQAREQETKRAYDSAIRLKQGIDSWMTKKEFQTVLNCLHPDRAAEGQKAKFTRAFNIFKRLEETTGKTVKVDFKKKV